MYHKRYCSCKLFRVPVCEIDAADPTCLFDQID